MATKAQNNETRKVNKLRYAEYYGQQPILDGLYADSKDGRIFKNLMPLILSQKNILQAYRTMKGNKGSHTPGTDALTIENIEAMEAKALCTEVKRRLGNYQPSPVRRKEIPKPNGKTRPLGIPCIWDRLIQQCILQILEPICEAKFSDNSYGFRPLRSAENAIAAEMRLINQSKLHFVVEVDIKSLSDVDSVETTMQKMTAWFGKFPQVQIEALTGEMKPEQMTAVIDRFAAGQTHILVSTTVVEVGVNVPNATVMLIKNAERFGLAQLHQLRGRVGRSDLQSYCVLLSDKTDNERLNTMTATNDGFEIAQKDLELRGTGQVLGVRQSGFDQCVDDMLKNPELYQSIRALIRRRAQKRLAGPDNA